MNSPKKGGSSTLDSLPYLKELNVTIIEKAQPIQFTPNINEHIHRWAPYVQGFSALFVQTILDQYKKVYRNPVILDPFAGCGTVLVQAKLNGYKSIGTELNPLLQFIAHTKLNSWDVSGKHLLKTYKEISRDKPRPAPSFLKSTSQFRAPALRNLEIIPPYMNGLDYVMNYKIEMGWLEFVHSQRDLKKIKDDMVVCDNVSKGLIRRFYESPSTYTNHWIEEIKADIQRNIARRGAYRRQDMQYIVHKYFDDLYKVMKNVVSSLKSGGRFILVVGDSLIADVYVPTDLLIAKIGLDSGLKIEKIEKARERRSGQIRSYKLRESIITLLKR